MRQKCKCWSCREVNRSIQSRRKVVRLSIGKQARAHVDKMFGLTTSKDYTTEFEPIGHTHTLLVLKTPKA